MCVILFHQEAVTEKAKDIVAGFALMRQNMTTPWWSM
jgi:hypothetical protein